MGLTPNHQLPYPDEADPPDVPTDIYELALRLDNILTALTLRYELRVAALEERLLEAGALVE